MWAWIGLGAARGLQGHLEEALEIFAEGIEKTQFEGPSVFVYRGEFLRLLGNHDDAARDLDKAVQHKPQRLSAWINRVLLDAEMGEVAPLNALTRTLKQTNPGLWCDAAESVGADPTDLNQSRAVMNATLAIMKGNRSSQVITYRLANGALRFAKWTTACARQTCSQSATAWHVHRLDRNAMLFCSEQGPCLTLKYCYAACLEVSVCSDG